MRALLTCAALGAMLLAGCESLNLGDDDDDRDRDADVRRPRKGTRVRGESGRAITVTAPGAATIRRGGTVALRVDVDRVGFRGPVRLSVTQLPAGVDAEGASEIQTDFATIVLRADRNADLVRNQAVRITVEGPDGMRATEQLALTVLE